MTDDVIPTQKHVGLEYGHLGARVALSVQMHNDSIIVYWDGVARFTKVTVRLPGPNKVESWHYRGDDDNGEQEGCTTAEALVHIAQMCAAKDEREKEHLLSPHYWAGCDALGLIHGQR